jgi:hypothetical protein
MNVAPNRIVYLTLRGIAAVGALILAFASMSAFVMPGLAYDEGPMPSSTEIQLRFVGSLLLAAAVVIPFRWTSRGVLFAFRLALFTGIGVWLCIAGAHGLVNFMGGTKHWLIVPISGLMILFGVALPYSLLLSRAALRAREPGV